uniref:Uncharacterized protein n=1 Tax=Ditylenchus dipsaci TaxID=166011 RepID=A0A915D6W5_9BILA
MVSRSMYYLTSLLLIFIVICLTPFVSPSTSQEQPLEVFVVHRRSTSPTPEENQLANIIFSGRISGAEEAEEEAVNDDVEKDHLVLDEEESQSSNEMDGRPPIVVLTEEVKQKPAKGKPSRKRYLVSRSALRQKLINGPRASENEQEDPLLLVEEAVSSPFDSRPSLNSLAASNKAVAEATAALLTQYHASSKKIPVRLCGQRLASRTKEICQHCAPSHLRPLFLVEKKRGGKSVEGTAQFLISFKNF